MCGNILEGIIQLTIGKILMANLRILTARRRDQPIAIAEFVCLTINRRC